MFGTVPRVLWERKEPPDAHNRVGLAARVLHLEGPGVSVLVDSGLGDSLGERADAMYALEAAGRDDLPFRWEQLTHVILTHLHFDHSGGLVRRAKPPDAPRPGLRAPQARLILQRANWERALAPGPRERASYLRDDVELLREADRLLVDGETEVLPGVRIRRSDGHTAGLGWVTVSAGRQTLAFPSDLVPTANHIHLPYVMSYDMSVEILLREKEDFLRRAVDGRWIVVFAHDRKVPAARLTVDAGGRFAIDETVDL